MLSALKKSQVHILKTFAMSQINYLKNSFAAKTSQYAAPASVTTFHCQSCENNVVLNAKASKQVQVTLRNGERDTALWSDRMKKSLSVHNTGALVDYITDSYIS